MKFIVSLFLLCIIGGCTVTDNPSAQTTTDMIPKMAYFKDQYGLCYAAIESYTYPPYKVLSFTNVSCKQIGM